MISGIVILPAGLSSKSPLSLSVGCTWNCILPITAPSSGTSGNTDPVITNVTALTATVVNSGLDVISTAAAPDPDISLNALTPSASNPVLDRSTATVKNSAGSKSASYPIDAEFADPVAPVFAVPSKAPVTSFIEYPKRPAPYNPPDTSSSTVIFASAVDTFPYMLSPVENPLLSDPYLKSR